ncbi:MAG TPA: ABC transporter ATP-binding protein [Aequorivita sp.]|nr:ABC transporter ATP-binding protein [Aequorivita sp.]
MKELIKKYFSTLVFFYRYIGNRILIMLILSLTVSVLDGFGLAMFLPLLQMVSGDGAVDPAQMGGLAFLIEGAEALGISLNLMSALAFMVVFFVFKGIAYYLNAVYVVVLRQSFIRSVRVKLLNALNVMSFKSFITSDAGQIQNTMSGEVSRVSLGFTTYFGAFQQGVMVLVYISFAFFIDVQFALLVTLGGILTNFLYNLIYSRTKEASRKLTGASHLYQGLIIQHVANFKYLRATGMISTHSEKLKNNIIDIEDSNKKIGILAGIGNAAREPLLVIVVAAVILIQVMLLGGAMGAILISLLFFYRALSSLMGMQQSWNAFLGVSGSLENMQDFLEELEEAEEVTGKLNFDKFQSEIKCKGLSFSFGETQVLNSIDLDIPINKSIAFVGESGSGKTTLVNVLAGLLEPSEGKVLIDGQSIQSLNKTKYQKRIGYITQEAVIFNDTIYNNISFWAEKTPENLKRFYDVIEQAALTEFLQELPNKEDTLLGNNGINVSGGQKQRISIARELFKDIDILIMDEATSALDSETEKAIQESIEALQGRYTLIIVAHRLATIRNVDKIVFMHKGKIDEHGSFSDLMQRVPRFRKMVELQEL